MINDPANTSVSLNPTAEGASDFRVAFSPYIWLTGFSGDAGLRGVNVNVNESFFDILDKTDSVFGLMGALDFEYKRFVFQVNGSWVTADLSNERGLAGVGTLRADFDVNALWTELFTGYRLLDEPLGDKPDTKSRLALDAFGGGRFTNIEAKSTLSAATPITLPGGGVIGAGASVGRDASADWFEPFVGLRAVLNIDENWIIQLRGDVGGFGVDGSEFAWQGIGLIGYRWNLDRWQLALFGGYRALGQDHTSGGFKWDVITHGPLLGASFSIGF